MAADLQADTFVPCVSLSGGICWVICSSLYPQGVASTFGVLTRVLGLVAINLAFKYSEYFQIESLHRNLLKADIGRIRPVFTIINLFILLTGSRTISLHGGKAQICYKPNQLKIENTLLDLLCQLNFVSKSRCCNDHLIS